LLARLRSSTISCGRQRQQFIASNTIVAERVLAEGDYVVVEARGRNRTKKGDIYENEYCWVIQMRDGKMARLVEYADTDSMQSVLKPCPTSSGQAGGQKYSGRNSARIGTAPYECSQRAGCDPLV
jgi:hypothetical protein